MWVDCFDCKMSSRVARAHDQKEREGDKVKLIYWHNAIPSLSLSFFIPLSCTARIVAQQYHKKCWKMLKRKVEKKTKRERGKETEKEWEGGWRKSYRIYAPDIQFFFFRLLHRFVVYNLCINCIYIYLRPITLDWFL